MDFAKLPRFKDHEAKLFWKIAEWSGVFGVDQSEIERQILLAHGWADSNPKKAPRSNIMRYLYNWMLIAQRKGSLLRKPRENFTETKPGDDEVMTAEDFQRMRENIGRAQ